MNRLSRHLHSENLAGVFRTLESLTTLGNRFERIKTDKDWIALNALGSSTEQSAQVAPIRVFEYDENIHFEVNVFVDALPLNFKVSDILDIMSIDGAEAIKKIASQKVTEEIYASPAVADLNYLATLLLEIVNSNDKPDCSVDFIMKFNGFLAMNTTLNRLQILHGLSHSIQNPSHGKSDRGSRRLMILILMISNGNGHLLLNALTDSKPKNAISANYILELAKRLLQQNSLNVDAPVIKEIWYSFFAQLDNLSPDYIDLIQYAPHPEDDAAAYELPLGASHLLPHSEKEHLSDYKDMFERLYERSLNRLESAPHVLEGVVIYALNRSDTAAIKQILDTTYDEIWSRAPFMQFISYVNRSDDGCDLLENRVDWLASQVNAHPGLASSVIEMLAMKGLRNDILSIIEMLNILPANADMLKDAVFPRRLDGFQQRHESVVSKKTLILTDISTSSSAFKSLVQSEEIHIYNPSPLSAIENEGNDDVKVFDSYTFNDKQEYIRQLSSGSEYIAATLAKKFVKDVKSDRLGEMFQTLYTALYMTLRVRLVGCFRHYEMRRHWQEICDDDYDDVIIIASNSIFASEMVDVVRKSSFAHCARLMALPASLKDLPKCFDAFDPYYVTPSHFLNTEPATDDVGISETLERIYDGITPSYKAKKADSAGIFVVRLASKTVPGTVVPVMKESIRQQDNYVLEIQTTKDTNSEFKFQSGPTQRRHSVNVPHVVSLTLKEEARALSRLHTDVVQKWFLKNKTFTSKVIREHLGEEYINTIFKIGIGFDLSSISYLISLYKNFEVIMNSVESFQVTVCPGRSVEAYLAQSMANARGQISMDIMNAWMSDKSTYATPRGDIVTAIDHWSSELLRDHFLIQKKSIKKLGTPRYDGIYQRAADEDVPALKEKCKLPPDKAVVCFATQPMDMEFNLEILSAILEARESGTNFCTIVKLHPREEEGRVVQYLDYIANLPTDVRDTVRLFKNENIIDTLICSDLVVTVFSNVATEANLCRKPTILCKFEGVAVPIPMDEMHLGRPAHSAEELTKFVAKALTDSNEMRKYHRLIDKFLGLNSHLKTDQTSKNVFGALKEKKLIGMGARRPLHLP